MFYLATVVPSREGAAKEEPLSDYGPYETGVEADKAAKEASVKLGIKVQPRRAAQAGDWRASCRAFLDTHSCLRLPVGWHLDPIPDHFAHVVTKSPSLLGFFESEAHGILGRVTALKPGRYLERFYPGLSMDERKTLAALFSSTDVLFATTPDEIEWVYENGPESCMTNAYHAADDEEFNSSIHPVRVYGAGDLAVAYTKNKDSDFVSERALCWPEKKIFGRIYGDGSCRLYNALIEEGYRRADYDDWNGARLLRVVEEDCEGDYHFVCPYIDAGHNSGSGSQHVVDEGDYLVISDHGFAMNACSTKGWVTAYFKPGFSPSAIRRAA